MADSPKGEMNSEVEETLMLMLMEKVDAEKAPNIDNCRSVVREWRRLMREAVAESGKEFDDVMAERAEMFERENELENIKLQADDVNYELEELYEIHRLKNEEAKKLAKSIQILSKQFEIAAQHMEDLKRLYEESKGRYEADMNSTLYDTALDISFDPVDQSYRSGLSSPSPEGTSSPTDASGVTTTYDIGTGLNMTTSSHGTPSDYQQTTTIDSAAPAFETSRMVNAPLTLNQTATLSPKSPWISKSRFGYTDPYVAELNLPPGFFRAGESMKKQVQEGEKPLQVDIEDSPHMQESSKSYYMDDQRRRCFERIPVWYQTPPISTSVDRRPYGIFTPRSVFKRKYASVRDLFGADFESPESPWGTGRKFHSYTDDYDMDEDSFTPGSDRSMEWEIPTPLNRTFEKPKLNRTYEKPQVNRTYEKPQPSSRLDKTFSSQRGTSPSSQMNRAFSPRRDPLTTSIDGRPYGMFHPSNAIKRTPTAARKLFGSDYLESPESPRDTSREFHSDMNDYNTDVLKDPFSPESDRSMEWETPISLNRTFEKPQLSRTYEKPQLNRTYEKSQPSSRLDKTFSPQRGTPPSSQMNRTFSPQRGTPPSSQMNRTFSPQRDASPSSQINRTFSPPRDSPISSQMNATFSPQRGTLPSSQMNRTFSPQRGTPHSSQMNRTFSPQRGTSPSSQMNRTFSPQRCASPSSQINRTFSPQRGTPPSSQLNRTFSPQRATPPSSQMNRTCSPQRCASPSPQINRTFSPQRGTPPSSQLNRTFSPQRGTPPSSQMNRTCSPQRGTPPSSQLNTTFSPPQIYHSTPYQ